MFYRSFFVFIGIVLVFAAMAKMQSLGDLAATSVVAVVISCCAELFIGCSNIIRKPDKKTHLLNFVLFACFSIYLLLKISGGYGSCNCFGSIEISAWRALTFDFLVLAGIVACSFGVSEESCEFRLSWLLPLVLVVAILAFWPSVFAKLRAVGLEKVVLEYSGNADVEIDLIDGIDHSIELSLTNNSDRKCYVTGCSSKFCALSTMVSEGIVTINPGETETVTIRLLRSTLTGEARKEGIEELLKEGYVLKENYKDRVPEEFEVTLIIQPTLDFSEISFPVSCDVRGMY